MVKTPWYYSPVIDLIGWPLVFLVCLPFLLVQLLTSHERTS